MEVNIKNTQQKIDKDVELLISDFLKFCNIANPINRKINTVIYSDENGGEVTHENKIVINIKNKSTKELIYDLSDQWMKIFSNFRKINLNGSETEVLIHKFLEINGNYQRYF